MTPRSAIARARAMRSALTPPEARLWVALRRLRAEGFHFRRQAPFRQYFLDFVCHAQRLVIEVDGLQHGEPEQACRDATRDAVLAQEGYRTLRFAASAVLGNLEGVAASIRLALDEDHTGTLRCLAAQPPPGASRLPPPGASRLPPPGASRLPPPGASRHPPRKGEGKE